jgi:diguanylate cyclase (GGDEF)-like protein
MPKSKDIDTELVKSSGDVFDMIEGTIDEHMSWLEMWHRAIVCQTPLDEKLLGDKPHLESRFGRWFRANIDKGFLDRAAFGELGKLHEQMHQKGRDLALLSAAGTSIAPKEYDDFIGLVTTFNLTIRRVRQGLRQAATESNPVTGLSNRENMLNELENERLHAERTKTECCLILADIDRFREVVETHGAESGDQVLFAAASRLLTKLRPYDRVYRYGGDEFLVCLRSTKESAAMLAAERLHGAFREQPFVVADGASIPVTASFGVSMLDTEVPIHESIERVDDAVIAAKRAGRNRCMMWSPELTD